MTDDNQTFEMGDKIQYCSSNPAIVHPILTVKGIVNQSGNHYQKIIVQQHIDEKPRRVYSNNYRIVEKANKK